MGDWHEPDDISSSESNSSKEELESELYSVLHYNCFSESISPELIEKYNIVQNDNKEFFISLKKGSPLKCEEETTDKSVIADKNVIEPKPTKKSAKNKSSYETESDCFVSVISNSPVEEFVKEPSQLSSSSKKVSNKAPPFNRNSTQSNNLENNTDNIILISDTDSDSDNSDVIIQEPEFEICAISSSSSVEFLSDSDNSNNNMILNTFERASTSIFPPDDGIEEEIKIKWREVSSPSTWSENMKRYYNRASKRMKIFDCKKILEEMKGKGTWEVLDIDRFPRPKGPVKRCTFCRQTDHLLKNCPKRFSNCFICGNPGHGATTCPFRMCFNCGEKNDVYVALCRRCQHDKHKKCDECNQVGHIRSNCPDTWRRYHSTTSMEFNVKPAVLNEKLMCCNCGHRGHLYEDCKKLYWSSYPPTSFLVQKNREINNTPGKRKSFNLNYDTPDSMRDHKKARWSEQPRQFQRKRYFDSSPLTPKKKKKKKNKSKSPKFKNNDRRNFHILFD